MKKYKVEITETLQKTVKIEADNKKDALEKVIKMKRLFQMITILMIQILRMYNLNMTVVKFGTVLYLTTKKR